MLQDLAHALRRLPAGAKGRIRDGSKLLEVAEHAGRRELLLRMALRSDTSGEPLLHAALSVSLPETDPDATPTLERVSRGRRDTHFTKREQQYLSAMASWALRVLSADDAATQLRPVREAAWQQAVRAIVTAATGASQPVLQRLAAGRLQAYDDLPATSRAWQLCTDLRDEGFLVQLDWHDDSDAVGAFRELLSAVRADAAPARVMPRQGDEPVEAVACRVAASIGPGRHRIIQIESGMDAHYYIAVQASDTDRVINAFRQLCVRAAVVE